MSGPFAFAAVSKLLAAMIESNVAGADLSPFINTFKVSVLPPDRVTLGEQEPSRLNLFLYNVTPNANLRNSNLPSRSGTYERLTNPPLALDLHYLLTAYGAADLHADALLGFGMQALHEVPCLSRDYIRDKLQNGVTDVEKLLPAVNLADQAELIKITPHVMNTEEMSKLWSAMQAKYRPSAAYLVTVVLIEATKSARAPLPVLTRGKDDRGPAAQPDLLLPFPTIDSVLLPNNQASALVGDSIALLGHGFADDKGNVAAVEVQVRFASMRNVGVPPADIVVLADTRGETRVPVSVPNVPAGWYRVSAFVMPTDKPLESQESNHMALSIAPKIISKLGAPILLTNVVDGVGDATITLACTPAVQLGQRISLVLGGREVVANEFTAPATTFTFAIKAIVPGEYRVRLRVDGVDSLLVDRSGLTAPKFDESQKITLA